MGKKVVIEYLGFFNFLKEQEIIIDVSEFNRAYLESKSNYSKLCDNCIKWEKLGLPNDCNNSPDYCLKKESDYQIINLYERLT